MIEFLYCQDSLQHTINTMECIAVSYADNKTTTKTRWLRINLQHAKFEIYEQQQK